MAGSQLIPCLAASFCSTKPPAQSPPHTPTLSLTLRSQPPNSARLPLKLSGPYSFSPVLGTLAQHLSDPGPKQKASLGPGWHP